MSTIDVDSFMSYILTNAGDATVKFQREPTSGKYTTMLNAINACTTGYTGPGAVPNMRIIVAMAGGTVAIDTSKGSQNTYANFETQSISDNHNTRGYAMTAILSNSGVGYEVSYSTTSYQSCKCVRTGFSSTLPLGWIAGLIPIATPPI